jgi:hypothetical protein
MKDDSLGSGYIGFILLLNDAQTLMILEALDLLGIRADIPHEATSLLTPSIKVTIQTLAFPPPCFLHDNADLTSG